MIVATASAQPRTCLIFFLVDSFHLERESERASLVAQRVKNLSGDLGLVPGLGRSPGEGNGYPLQYSFLENYGIPLSLWTEEPGRLYIVHAIAKSGHN